MSKLEQNMTINPKKKNRKIINPTQEEKVRQGTSYFVDGSDIGEYDI